MKLVLNNTINEYGIKKSEQSTHMVMMIRKLH